MVIVPILLVAGLTVGLGAAIYANREEIKEIYEHREELFSLIQQKRLEWKLKRRQRRRERQQQQQYPHHPQQSFSGSDNSDVYTLKEFDMDSDSMPASTSFYTNGHSSSAAAAADDEASTTTREVRRRRNYIEDERFGVEMYGFHRFPASSTVDSSDDIYQSPRSQRSLSRTESEFSSEPALSFDETRPIRHRQNFDELSSVGDSYSEISTPSISDAMTDDYQSVGYLSEDDSSGYRLQRVIR